MEKPAFNPNAPFQPAAKPEFDPSSPFQPAGDSMSSGDNPMSYVNSASRGLIQGASLGFGDEIAGGLHALKAAATDPNKRDWNSLVTEYKKMRDTERDANAQAAAQNPLTYNLSALGGGLAVPGSTFLKAGKLATSLPGVAGVLTAIPELTGVAEGVGAGAAAGAAGGLGNSDADSVSGALKDTLHGAKVGAEIGGVIPAGVLAAKGTAGLAADILSPAYNVAKQVFKPLDIIGSSTAKGLEGVNLNDLEGNLDELGSTSKNLANKALGIKQGLQQEYSDLLEKYKNNKIDVSEFTDQLGKLKQKYADVNNPAVQNDIGNVEGIVKDYTEGAPQKVSTNVPYTKLKRIDAQPSARELLTQKLAQQMEQERILGNNASSDIIESPDQKYLTPVIKNMEGAEAEAQANAKVYGLDNGKASVTPDALDSAESGMSQEDQLEMLRSKLQEQAHKSQLEGQLLGKDVQANVVDTGDELYPLGILKTLQGEAGVPTMKVGSPVPNTPGSPARWQGSPASFTQNTTQRVGGSNNLSAKQIFDLQKLLGEQANSGDKMSGMGKQFATEADQALKPMAEQAVPGLQDLNRRYTNANNITDQLGLNKDSLVTTPLANGQKVQDLDPSVLSKIQNIIAPSEQSTLASNKSNQALDILYKNMEALGHDTSGLRNQVANVSQNVGLSRLLNANPTFGSHGIVDMGVKGIAKTGNLLGRGLNNLDTVLGGDFTRQLTASTAANLPAQKDVGHKVYAMDDNALMNVSQSLMSNPNLASQATALQKAISSGDNQSKNSVLFSLMQRPDSREILQKHVVQ